MRPRAMPQLSPAPSRARRCQRAARGVCRRCARQAAQRPRGGAAVERGRIVGTGRHVICSAASVFTHTHRLARGPRRSKSGGTGTAGGTQAALPGAAAATYDVRRTTQAPRSCSAAPPPAPPAHRRPSAARGPGKSREAASPRQPHPCRAQLCSACTLRHAPLHLLSVGRFADVCCTSRDAPAMLRRGARAERQRQRRRCASVPAAPCCRSRQRRSAAAAARQARTRRGLGPGRGASWSARCPSPTHPPVAHTRHRDASLRPRHRHARPETLSRPGRRGARAW